MFAYPFWDSLFTFNTADSASTPARARCCGASRTRPRARSTGSLPSSTNPGAAAEGEALIGEARRRSRGEHPDQPFQVALVVPRPDRGAQPRPSRDVTQHHAARGESYAF